MKAICIIGIYFLMWFLMTFICKYLDAKYPSELADDAVPNEFLGLLWPIIAPILILMGLWLIIKYIGKMMDKYIIKYVGKMMDKFIDKIIIVKK